MSFKDVISFDPRIFHNLGIISSDIRIVRSSTLVLHNGQWTCRHNGLYLQQENLLANCHFSKTGILQISRNSDLNKVQDMI